MCNLNPDVCSLCPGVCKLYSGVCNLCQHLCTVYSGVPACSTFFVYCKCCCSVQPGKLRVRCQSCRHTSLTLSRVRKLQMWFFLSTSLSFVLVYFLCLFFSLFVYYLCIIVYFLYFLCTFSVLSLYCILVVLNLFTFFVLPLYSYVLPLFYFL